MGLILGRPSNTGMSGLWSDLRVSLCPQRRKDPGLEASKSVQTSITSSPVAPDGGVALTTRQVVQDQFSLSRVWNSRGTDLKLCLLGIHSVI